MALGEFSLIDRYFKRSGNVGSTPGTIGVGDDAAILPMPPGHKLVACKDVLIEGRHFFYGSGARQSRSQVAGCEPVRSSGHGCQANWLFARTWDPIG